MHDESNEYEGGIESVRAVSPTPVNFDDLKGEDGCWSARDLQKPLGYDSWRRFEDAIERAMISCEASGMTALDHFDGVGKVIESGRWGTQEVADYRLTRFAAYLVAMNGDPRKPEIAAAQAYFAIKTREAETNQVPSIDPRYADHPLHKMIVEVIDNGYQILSLKESQKATDGRVVEVTAEVQKVKQDVVELREDLAPKVRSWERLVDDDGLIELAIAAQSLKFTPPGKKASGRTTFNDCLREIGWLCYPEPGFDGTRPTQVAINNGLMDVKRQWLDGPRMYTNQAFLTPKGYEKLERIISVDRDLHT